MPIYGLRAARDGRGERKGKSGCCQVAEIPARKLKRGRRKNKVGQKNLWLNFGRILQKRSRRNFLKEFPSFTVITNTRRQWQNLIYNFVDPSAERCFAFYVKIGKTFSGIGRTFFMYWLENNFETWQHWHQHTHITHSNSRVLSASLAKW